jgi:hypothetical protein
MADMRTSIPLIYEISQMAIVVVRERVDRPEHEGRADDDHSVTNQVACRVQTCTTITAPISSQYPSPMDVAVNVEWDAVILVSNST